MGFSPVRLARYTLALNALCMDPRQFYGHDLIGTLQHHEEPPTDYEFALTTLAACNAQAHGRKRQIRRLLDITNAAQDHNLGSFFMKKKRIDEIDKGDQLLSYLKEQYCFVFYNFLVSLILNISFYYFRYSGNGDSRIAMYCSGS